MARKLFLIERIDDYGWDENIAHVIRAYTVDEARQIAADTCADEGKEVWLNSTMSKVTQITTSGDSEVVLTSFRAG